MVSQLALKKWRRMKHRSRSLKSAAGRAVCVQNMSVTVALANSCT